MRIMRLAVSAFLVGACSAVDPCSSVVKCYSGLYVRFSSPPTGGWRVEVASPQLASPLVYDCARSCPEYVPFQGPQQPTAATVTVTYQGRTTITDVNPVFEDQYVNGKSCPAVCTWAFVTVPLP